MHPNAFPLGSLLPLLGIILPMWQLLLGTTSAYTGTTLTGKVSACSSDNCLGACGTSIDYVNIPDTCTFSTCTTFSALTGRVTLQIPKAYKTLPDGATDDPPYGNLTCLFYAAEDCAGNAEAEGSASLVTAIELCVDTSTGWLSALCFFGPRGCSA